MNEARETSATAEASAGAPAPSLGPGPFQRQLLLHFGAGVNQVTGQVTAPQKLGLVIETITADIGVDTGEQANLFVETTAGGVSAMHTVALDELPLTPRVFQSTQDVRLYADAASTITVTVTRIGSNLQAIPKPELVTLSGHTT